MKKWENYTTNEIKPQGWIKTQLKLQANGLCGNLDKMWRDVKDSAWIGGDADGWERVPYWLDGFIPMAYLLEDDDLICRAKKYMNAIIDRQSIDGWICPCDDDKRASYDTWTALLISKVLTVYYECSGEERALDSLYRMMKNFYKLLKDGDIRLFDWGKFRWFEGFIALEFLSSKFNDDWIVDLAKILKEQGADYTETEDLWIRPLNKWRMETHIVNINMMLKYEAVSHNLLGLPYTDDAERMIKILEKYNGMPIGTFTGDECLSGLSPIQGAELCSVVELMYSYELLYAYTGDSKWAERLELLAFNALPATISDDMWTHQYDQQSNQIACQLFPGKPIFRTNNADSTLFGLEPNFGCCTANFGQGWPKFTLSAFVHKEDTIKNVLPIPSKLNCDVAQITLETNYPFENTFIYKINAKKNFTFDIRIPHFAENLYVYNSNFQNKTISNDGNCSKINAASKYLNKKENYNELSFECLKGEKYTFEISYTTTPHFEKRPHDLVVAKCGSLIYALPIKYEAVMHEYERDGVERKFPYCDYEYIPKSPWDYAYFESDLLEEKRQISEIPFSSKNPPVVLQAKAVHINWGYEDGYDIVCAKEPQSRLPFSEAETVELYPYGCAKLRMTELPLLR